MASKSSKQSAGIKNLRKVRRIAGLTQEQLGKIIPVAYGTARDVENGHKPFSDELVQIIAKRLGCGYEKDEDSGLLGLTTTQANPGDISGKGSDREYTHDWFVHWNEIMLRKEMYRVIVSRHRRVFDEILEVACGLDTKYEMEDSDATPFATSDEVVGKMVENSKALLENKSLYDALVSELPNRDFIFEHFRTIQDDLEKSHKRYHKLKERLGVLKPRE